MYLKKYILIIISLFFFLSVFYKVIKPENSTILIGKSNWPVWDLFEYASKKNNNYTLKYFNYDSLYKIYENYKEENLDAALSTIYEAILAYAEGTPVKIIALLDYTNGADLVLVHSEITRLIELKNKKVGAEYGTISHFTALKALEKGGLNKNDVTFIFKPMEELIIDFEQNKIDAIATFEPFLSIIKENNRTLEIFTSKEIPRAICDVFYINPDKINPKSKEITKLRRSWSNISNKVLHKEKLITKEMNRYYKENHLPYKFSIDGIKITGDIENKIALSPDGYLIESLNEMMLFMLEHEVIKYAFNVQDLLYD